MNWKYEENRIYSVGDKEEVMAEATFKKDDKGEVNIGHTYVNPVLRGQGVAGQMMEVLVDHLKEKDEKIYGTCSYANMWLVRNKEKYQDLISDENEKAQVACKLDGRR